MLSNGESKSKSNSKIELCYTKDGIVVENHAMGQKYFSENGYDDCNSAIFNLDVAELFIAPYIDSGY